MVTPVYKSSSSVRRGYWEAVVTTLTPDWMRRPRLYWRPSCLSFTCLVSNKFLRKLCSVIALMTKVCWKRRWQQTLAEKCRESIVSAMRAPAGYRWRYKRRKRICDRNVSTSATPVAKRPSHPVSYSMAMAHAKPIIVSSILTILHQVMTMLRCNRR